MNSLEVGICSWSVNRADIAVALSTAKRTYAISVAHVGIFDQTSIEQADPDAIRTAASEAGVEICATFVGFEGLDRTSIASIAQTGGLVPDDLFEERLTHLARGAALTKALDAEMLAAHLGAVPSPSDEARYNAFVNRVRRASDVAAEHGVTLLAETGQEPADALYDFLTAVDCKNVGVNFDPGNMVICGTGDPVRAVTTLADRIRLVHLKDAIASSNPGVERGRETRLGDGEANIPRVISKLRALGYHGPLLIERSLPPRENHTEDIEYVRSMLF